MELFANPKIFVYMLFAALAAGLLYYLGLRARRRALKTLFKADNYKNLIPSGLSKRRAAADILLGLGILFLFIALAAPQWGRENILVEAHYSQAVIAVDISNSMLAQDVKPNRLESAKTMLAMLLENMTAERAGLIAFTSQAYLQAPVTSDIRALKTLAAALSTDMLPAQGTALAPAVKLAAKMLGVYPGKKALVIITDGEDHEPQDIQAAVNAARESGVKIIAVGIGSAEGELIPVKSEGGQRAYKKDAQGKTVITKLDENTLRSLAQATGGAYIKFTNPQQTADNIAAQLAALDKSLAQASGGAAYKNRYQIPLFIGLVLLMAAILVPLRKVK